MEPGAVAAALRRVAEVAPFVRYMLTPVEAITAGFPERYLALSWAGSAASRLEGSGFPRWRPPDFVPFRQLGAARGLCTRPAGGYLRGMIVRERPGALALLYILRGSILPVIARPVLVIVVVATLVTWAHHLHPDAFRSLSPAPLTLIGLALSIFLGFRNNTCYERWWEGRRQWGQLVAESLGFARDAQALLDPARARTAGLQFIAFAAALRTQLRGHSPAEPPQAILTRQAAEFAELRRAGALTDVDHRLFADRLQAATNIQLACERLASTPMPFAYSLLLHRTAWLFCLFAPFCLVATLGLATPLGAAVLAYAFFGLDALGEQLEQPFSETPNALPLNALVRNIERAVLGAFGETDLPAILEPKDHVLL